MPLRGLIAPSSGEESKYNIQETFQSSFARLSSYHCQKKLGVPFPALGMQGERKATSKVGSVSHRKLNVCEEANRKG